MHRFRTRLILALVAGITAVSLASTYFEVLARKHVLRRDLERRTGWLATSLQPFVEKALAAGAMPDITAVAQELRSHDEALGLAIYDAHGALVSAVGPSLVIRALSIDPVRLAIKRGSNAAAFGHTGDQNWLEEAIPLHAASRPAGALVVLEDARFIRAESAEVWRQTFWRIVALVLLIVAVTAVVVRWSLLRPVSRLAERLRLLRMGEPIHEMTRHAEDLSLFTPIAREVENITESLLEARAAAAAEARLREAGENLWTAERLTVHRLPLLRRRLHLPGAHQRRQDHAGLKRRQRAALRPGPVRLARGGSAGSVEDPAHP